LLLDADRSSCRVTGLDGTSAYEARVAYVSSCGCRSEASEVSDRCVANPSVVQQQHAAAANAAAAAGRPCVGSPGGAAGATLMPIQAWSGLLGMQAPYGGVPPAGQTQTALVAQSAIPPALHPGDSTASMQQHSGWRCSHGNVLPAPPVPEIHLADEYGFALSVQWPSVAHATAYVVDLREAGSQSVERFMRSAGMATRGSIVELRVGGLRPSTGPNGQRYSAQVRCVAECGCESAPSMPGWSRNPGLQAQPFGHMLSAGPLSCQDGMLAAVPMQQSAMQQPPLPQQVAHTLYGISDPAMVAAMGMPPWLPGTQASVDVPQVQVAAADCSPAGAAGAAMPTYFATGASTAAAAPVEPSVMEPPSVGFTAPTAPVVAAARAQPTLPTAMLAFKQMEPPTDLVGYEECLLLD